ncbi:prenyltransferase [uncultured Corynebacterium sp.]|uniref:prenyltransferase n=1 Tax=uncultured Corynebacterium sp. TaxID=159447 RepID=UPI0025CEBEF7|nr:prenyltransferase [uncultured Corynebacterium sp.]
MRTILSVLGASRPISWVNTAFPFGAAYLVAGGSLDLVFWLGVVFFLVPYNIAMYGINDVFDYESDIRNPRKGGVEGAVLSKDLHAALLWASAITVVPFAVYLYAAGTWASAAWLSVALFAVVAYSAPGLRFKERPFLDSVTSSTHFVAPALVGGAMAPGPLGGGFWLAMLSFFLWGLASHALGAVQDVRADRDGGLSSIATVLGARTTARLATVTYALAAALLLFLPSPAWIVALAAAPYALNAGRFWNITDDTCEDAHRGWTVFLWLNFLAGAVVSITLLWVWVG